MTTKIKPIPDGYPTLTPYLILKTARKAIDFYKQALGATERMRMESPDGKIMHAELQIGDSVIMLADEFPEMGALSPESVGGSPVFLHLYVEDVDSAVKRATDAGAAIVYPVQNKFYGDRSGTLKDPFGYRWTLSTHVEDVPPEEMKRRMAAMQQQG